MTTARDFWCREFELASKPAAWALNAYGLRAAAEVLWNAYGEDHHLGVSYMLLTGYALEKVIKALLVLRRPELCKPGRAPRWPGGGHNLPNLFDEAGVDLSSDERQLLDRLRAFITWRGRYPIPTNPEVLMTERAMSWVTSPVPVVVSPTDRRAAVELFDRVMDMLPF